MAEILSNQDTPEPKGENAKLAEEVSSSSEEEEIPGPKKTAVTKKRTFKSLTNVQPCGIYSSLSSDAGLNELKFSNPGFSFDEDEDEDEDDDDLQIGKKKKRIGRQLRGASSKNSPGEVYVVDDRTPEKNATTPQDLRSPSPPPPPSPKHVGARGRRQRTPKKTTEILRQLESRVTQYRIASLPTLNDSSPMTTPGGSSRVIDLESPGTSPSRRRKNITVKVRTRGGIQKFIMQMNEMFTNVIDTLARLEGVDKMQIKLVKGDDDIAEFDTPKAAKLRISDILECVIIDPSSVSADSELDITPNIDECVQIKVQGQDRTSKMNYTHKKDCPMREIMAKYSQSCGIPLDKLKFYFDGDVISPDETPEDLDMDEQSVVDVVSSA